MKKQIYLIWDRKWSCVTKATTNRTKADEEVARLNAEEPLDRYRVMPIDDFASRDI